MAAAAGDEARDRWGTHTLFFYGTLVHPAILERVIGNSGAHLRVRNAVLPAFATWHVNGVDYPALVALSDRAPKVSTEVGQDDVGTSGSTAAVPGTVVSGLTDADLRYLDLFEGDEYIRKSVDVIAVDPVGVSNALRPRDASLADILSDLTPARCAEVVKSSQTAAGDDADATLPLIRAQAYVWCAPLDMLEDRRWLFVEFAQSKASRWVGAQADHEYTDVDRERGGGA